MREPQAHARLGIPAFAGLLLVLVGAACGPAQFTEWLPLPPADGALLDPVPSTGSVAPGSLRAGAARVDITPPVGVPLAGYGGIVRRQIIPDLDPANYFTLFKPSLGTRDPLYAKTLVLSDGHTTVVIVALDAIATDRDLVETARLMAVERGVDITADNLLVCSSHTHSGPGAVTTRLLWGVVGADLLVPSIRDAFAAGIADSIVHAYGALQPARLGISLGELTGVTGNRRQAVSPELEGDSIDPELAVIRVDRPNGEPLAVVWNFAIHGVAWGGDSMEYSADVMGMASATVEQALGCPVLFANAAEGDIAPINSGEAAMQDARELIAPAILGLWETTDTSDAIEITNKSETVAFGPARLNLGAKLLNPPDPAACADQCLGVIQYQVGLPLEFGPQWIENEFRFQAIRLNDTVIATVPGEPIMELGRRIKSDGRALGFRNVLIFALANGHMSYIATESEYFYGGYEALATFWGPATAARVRTACQAQMAAVR